MSKTAVLAKLPIQPEAKATFMEAFSAMVEAVEAAAGLMARPSVGAAWDRPSALTGMTVGGLAAHLVRAAGATLAYLDRTSADTEPAVSKAVRQRPAGSRMQRIGPAGRLQKDVGSLSISFMPHSGVFCSAMSVRTD